MFENVTGSVLKHLAVGDVPWWVPLLILFGAWIIFMAIRDFWCWFFRTTAIANQLEIVNLNLRWLQMTYNECHAELLKTTANLERVTESLSTSASNRPAGSAGS
jgi:hypothetical protein